MGIPSWVTSKVRSIQLMRWQIACGGQSTKSAILPVVITATWKTWSGTLSRMLMGNLKPCGIAVE